MNKKDLRKIYLKKRDQIHNQETDNLIINRFINLPSFKNAKSIFVTKSIGSEIDTNKIIQQAFELNKKVLIPKVNKEENIIIPTEIKNSNNLVKGIFNIPEPKEFPDEILIPDLVLVPGLIFSESGYRIGYGGGFYDKYIEKYNPNSIAMVYDEFVFKKIPIEEFDYPVNQILTEKRLINLK